MQAHKLFKWHTIFLILESTSLSALFKRCLDLNCSYFLHPSKNLSFIDQQEMHSYYQGEIVNSQNSFHLDSSMPSHEENETTDVPSSPVAQTPTFDYYNNNQQVRNICSYFHKLKK